MKTMYPPGYHLNDFVATLALGNMMYTHTTHTDIYIYIYIYIYLYIYIYIHTNLPVSDIVKLPHPRSGDSPLLTSKLATMTQSVQTTIPPYQP